MEEVDKNQFKNKVFVGISGGVDSSVSVALLKEAGYDVTGVFIRVWYPEWLQCDWKAEKRDAMRVCAQLGIPFKLFNAEKEYKKEVVDYMISEYQAGRTPNPDVMCNKHIKFDAFYNWAMNNGADYVATGHYCRNHQILNSKSQTNSNKQSYKLQMGVDKGKDQSYFLWNLTQDKLKHILFPIGEYKKEEVRKLAKKFNLFTAEKKDSQGICFLGQVNLKEFLSKYVKTEKGDVLDEKGGVIGEHDGAIFYTLGQRHGFRITTKDTKRPVLYIIGKNLKANTITVSAEPKANSSRHGEESYEPRILVKDLNWIGGTPKPGRDYKCRYRHLQKLIPCQFTSLKNDYAEIVLVKSARDISPGQSLVIYDGEECVGGGIIN